MYRIGELIKRTRESLNMTQETLSDGICSVVTLSRIENGKTLPNRANFQALMERMGKSGERYLPFLHSDDMELLDAWEEIERKMGKRKYEEVAALLNEYETKLEMGDLVNQQFVTRLRATNDYYRGRINENELRERLLQALRCTLPRFDEKHFPTVVFSRCEVRILCNIAVSYAEEGNLDEAIALLRNVEQYFNQVHLNKNECCISEILLISNLAQALGRNGNAQEALEMNEKGISMCMKSKKGENLATFLYNAGFEMEKLKMDEDSCKEKFIQAYYVAELADNKQWMRYIANYWKKKYGSNIAV